MHIYARDSRTALAILNKDFNYADEKLIDSLQRLVEDNRPSAWPDFIFLHLVGVDFTSHDEGPNSPDVENYLRKLDAKLGPVLRILEGAERRREREEIISLLTADHGFDTRVKDTWNIEKSLNRVDPKLQVLK